MIHCSGARGALFRFSSPAFCLNYNNGCIELTEDSSFNLTNALLVLRSRLEVNWTESACVRWTPFSFAKGVVVRLEAFTGLWRKPRTSGKELPLQTLSTVIVICLREDYFRYYDSELAVARYCCELPLPPANALGVLATSFEYKQQCERQAYRDLADLKCAARDARKYRFETKI